MADTARKLQNALDECRLLMLGAQVLIGFHFRAVLEAEFASLSPAQHAAFLAGLVTLLCVAALLIGVGAHHQVVCGGEPSPIQERFTGRILCIALGPLAAALGIDIFFTASVIVGQAGGAALGLLAAAAAGALWYWWPLHARSRHGEPPMKRDSKELEERIREVLTEARVVLPGAQALLGFGMVAVLMREFAGLPWALRVVHLCSLMSIASAVCLVVAPAAFHRIAERGEPSERLHRVASRLLLCGIAALGLGLALAFWLAVEQTTGSRAAGVGSGLALLIGEYGLWFGWTTLKKAGRRRGAGMG